MDKINELITMLEESIESFEGDPADSDYQRGYLAALIESKKVAESLKRGGV